METKSFPRESLVAAGTAPPDIDFLNLEDSNSEGKNDTTGTSTCTHGDSDEDPLKEIFAAEKDDDDFDFHSDRFANETTLQPVQATPLRNDFTINEVVPRIKNLLNESSYARLSSMSETSWKQWILHPMMANNIAMRLNPSQLSLINHLLFSEIVP